MAPKYLLQTNNDRVSTNKKIRPDKWKLTLLME